MLDAPRIAFALRNGTHLAYQVAGSGSPDIVFVGGSMATTMAWEDPATAKGFRRLASFARLTTYDQWGTGQSDRFNPSDAPNLTDLVHDLAAVIDAADVIDPVLFGTHNGGAVAALYAVTHPVRQLILCNTWARLQAAEDFPIGFSDRVLDRLEERYRTEWGQGRIYNEFAPRYDDAPPGHAELASTSQNQLVTIFRINRTYDIRSVLPTISVPTLVIHLEGNANIPPDHGRFIAEAIAGARLVLLPGTDQLFLRNYANPVIDEVERFVTGDLSPFTDRFRATILFTDIVDSTPRAAALGDEAWSALIDGHNAQVKRQVVATAAGSSRAPETASSWRSTNPTPMPRALRSVVHGGRHGPGPRTSRRCPCRGGVPHGQGRPVGPGRALCPAALRATPRVTRCLCQRPCGSVARHRTLNSTSRVRPSSRGSLVRGRSSRPACRSAEDPPILTRDQMVTYGCTRG